MTPVSKVIWGLSDCRVKVKGTSLFLREFLFWNFPDPSLLHTFHSKVNDLMMKVPCLSDPASVWYIIYIFNYVISFRERKRDPICCDPLPYASFAVGDVCRSLVYSWDPSG